MTSADSHAESAAVSGDSDAGTVATLTYRTAEGLSLVADVGGDRRDPAVVLMHGGGQTRHSWSGAMDALLGAGYRVINYDARGHGDSDWAADGNYLLKTRAQDMLTVIADETPPVALVGASMGGATAIAAVSHGLFTPAALVLVDIVPRVDRRGVARIRSFMEKHPDGFASVGDAARAVAEYNPHRSPASDPAGLLKNLRRRADGRFYWHWDPRILRDPELDIAEFESTVAGLSQARGLPIQLVRGLESDIVNDHGVEDLRRALPQLEVCDVEGAGHMVAGDRNDRFNAGVLEFLRRTVPPRR
jgi:pimeloyl-ACP methyl ester carboxylesterase